MISTSFLLSVVERQNRLGLSSFNDGKRAVINGIRNLNANVWVEPLNSFDISNTRTKILIVKPSLNDGGLLSLELVSNLKLVTPFILNLHGLNGERLIRVVDFQNELAHYFV